MSGSRRALLVLLAGAIGAAALALAIGVLARTGRASFTDEALALLRYRAHLATEGAFAWNPGSDRAVGAISPLQLTLLAAFHAFVHDAALALAAVGLGSTLLALAFCVGLARGAARSARDPRIAFDGLVALVVGLAAGPLALQTTNGLEATLAMAMTGAFTWMWSQSERVDVSTGGIVLGVFGAALFATRADLAIFGLGVPLAVALLAREAQRRQALVALAVAASGSLAVALGLAALHGSPLPLAFALPRSDGGTWTELARFLAATAPLWALVAAELALGRGSPRAEERALQRAFAVASALFLVDATLGAPAVDVSDLRMLLAALPPLVFLGARALVAVRRWTEWRGARVPVAPLLALAFGALLAPLHPLIRHVELAGAALAAGRAGRFELELTRELDQRWPGIAALAPLAPPPSDPRRGRLVVACAPAGEVGAALPLADVIDVSGAHDAAIARGGFDAERLCAALRPDWIWLAPPERAAWSRDLRASAAFARDYELRELGAVDVAVRRTGAYRAELARIAGSLAAR